MQIIPFSDLPAEIQTDFSDAQQARLHYFPQLESVSSIGAVVVADGIKYLGANIKRRSVNNSTCAERMALDKALFDNVKKIDRIVIFGFNKKNPYTGPVTPCGACREIINEILSQIGQDNVDIYLSDAKKEKVIKTDLNELLPLSYGDLKLGDNFFVQK